VVTRMLRMDGRKEGRTDSSIIISLRNFVGEGIINMQFWKVNIYNYIVGDNTAA
jgi:hypothetical protein